MAARSDFAAVIVATFTDGKMSGVRRYQRGEIRTLEADILALRRAGRTMKVTYLHTIENDGTGLDQSERDRVEAAQTTKLSVVR